MSSNQGQRFMSGAPLFGSLFDDTLDQAQQENERLRRDLSGISTPDYENYSPEAYLSTGDLRPEDALYQTYTEDPRLKSAQMSALDKLAGYADTGLTPMDEANFARARGQAGQIMNSGNQAALQNAEARGVGGSGLEFAMREMANQAGAQNAQDAGLSHAATAAQQRADYLSKYQDALSSTRAQDAQTGQYNTSAINQFNMANTNARNQAQESNLANRQALNNANVDNRNNAVQYNNQMKGQKFNDQMTKFGGQQQVSQNATNLYAADNAARTQDRATRTKFLTDMMSSMGGGMGGGAK